MIGVFDSGIGGLSVVRHLFSHVPDMGVTYFGDVARGPYGNRGNETLLSYSCEISDFLMGHNVSCIVIACHTASAVCAADLRGRYDVPVFDVVSTGSRIAIQKTKSFRIGVMATQATVASNRYIDSLKSFSPQATVFQYPCRSLATFVEDSILSRDILVSAVSEYLSSTQDDGIDVLVLGCTHYPLIADVISEVVGPDVILVDPGHEVAHQVHNYLAEASISLKGDHRFYVSDDASHYSALIERFLGTPHDCIVHRF